MAKGEETRGWEKEGELATATPQDILLILPIGPAEERERESDACLKLIVA